MFSKFIKSRKFWLGTGLSLSLMGYKLRSKKEEVEEEEVEENDGFHIDYTSKRETFETILASYEKQLDYFTEERKDDWKKVSEKDGCAVSTLVVPYSDYYVIKGTVTARTRKSIKRIVTEISDVAALPHLEEMNKKVDEECIYLNILKDFKHGFQLGHGRWTTHNWFVSDRDFVLVRNNLFIDRKTGYVFGGSLPDAEEKDPIYPVDTECVRGKLHTYFWKVERKDKENVEITFCSHIDAAGSVPIWLYNIVCSSAAYQALRMARFVVEVDSCEDNL